MVICNLFTLLYAFEMQFIALALKSASIKALENEFFKFSSKSLVYIVGKIDLASLWSVYAYYRRFSPAVTIRKVTMRYAWFVCLFFCIFFSEKFSELCIIVGYMSELVDIVKIAEAWWAYVLECGLEPFAFVTTVL